MQTDLRDLFERALDDEPVPPPGHSVVAAMARGRHIRRRRRALVGGAVAAVVAVAAGGLSALAPVGPGLVAMPAGPGAAPPGWSTATIAPGGPGVAPVGSCPYAPGSESGSAFAIFLDDDLTASQRSRLEADLRADPLVRDLRFESRGDAYERFKDLWSDSPDFVASIQAGSMPASFRLRLADRAYSTAFAAKYQTWTGVQSLISGDCVGTKR